VFEGQGGAFGSKTACSVMSNLKLKIAYDGTSYVGWQRQATGSSVQGCVEAVLGEIEGGSVIAVGAGRTDAGVHALGQVANVRLRRRMAVGSVIRAVNSRLPKDIRVVDAEIVQDSFHARFDATAKVYRYRLIHGEVMNPFVRRYGWWQRAEFDTERMNEAGQLLVGEHDFASFQAAGSSTDTTVRRLFSLSVTRAQAGQLWSENEEFGDMTIIEVRGSGFLRHMVRVIVGSLVQVGVGRWDNTDIERALVACDRDLAGPTAPPQGLFLMRVDYE